MSHLVRIWEPIRRSPFARSGAVPSQRIGRCDLDSLLLILNAARHHTTRATRALTVNMKAVLFLAILAVAAVAKAQGDVCVLTIEYDNRGSKVMDPKTEDKILKALAKDVFQVESLDQLARGGGLGQSSLLNHMSTVSYIATGPTTNGKSLCANCQATTTHALLGLRSSKIEKSLKKATDTWLPGDSVSVKKAQCSVPSAPKGRKMAM